MGPVELLQNKRKALVSDDEAILLLLVAKGPTRPHKLKDSSKMAERTFWRCLQKCQEMEWIESTKAKTAGKGRGPGLLTVLKLTSAGEVVTGKILGVEREIKMAIDGIPPAVAVQPNQMQGTLPI